jgi:diguanylate cyclase (GGDEF)-like protein
VVSINPMVVVVLLFALQGTLGLALCLLFGRYHVAYRRPHLRLWSISFGMLAIYMLLAGVALHASQASPSAFALRTGVSLLSQVAAYLHVAFLVLGTLSLGARHDPPAWLRNGVAAAATVLGITAALAYTWDVGAVQERIFARVGLRYLIGAAAYVGIALALMSGPWRNKPLGQKIVAFSFLAFGVVLVGNFVLLTSPGVSRSLADYAPWFSLFDLVAEFSIGMGLVIWLHEDERGRADRASRQVEQLTYYDGLTGLPNRNLFASRLAGHLPEAAVARQRYVVAAFGPDNPRQLREALGEGAVEVLLQRIAGRLRMLVPGPEPLVARIDGDRFAVAFGPVGGTEAAAARAQELRTRLDEAAGDVRSDLVFTSSAGIALYPDDAREAEGLIAAALSAQAAASRDGGRRVEFYSLEQTRRGRDQLSLVADARRALAGNGLELHYQPVLDMRHGGFGFVEALVRWNHPLRGPLAPGAFLPAMAEAGLMPDLDRWVLRAACRTIALRRAAGAPWPTVAINVSAEGFQLSDFPDWVAEALAEARLPAHALELEITEATALRDADKAKSTLQRLKQLGVSMSLDDFGVGYSSMGQLKRLAVDRIKIDRSFVQGALLDRKDDAIVTSMIGLGASLGLQVVAEGIETAAQLAHFRRLGVDHAQGFLIGRPMSAEMLSERLRELPPALAAG